MDTLELRDNATRSRYELLEDGHVLGVADYRIVDGVVVMPHTEIQADRRDAGLGERLVQFALDDVRRSQRRVVPSCWFVAQFIDEHPEYRDLLER